MSKEDYESHVKMIVEPLKEEKMYAKFSNNVEAKQRGSYLDVEGIKCGNVPASWHCQKEQTISFITNVSCGYDAIWVGVNGTTKSPLSPSYGLGQYSMIALVKVRWDSKSGPELTWERKDQMRSRELKRNGNVMVVNHDKLVGSYDLDPILRSRSCKDKNDPRWNECFDNEDELQSFRHKAQQQNKIYEEREESCWILHLRTGIFYPKGHERVMNEVPDGAAISASSYWLRNNDMYRV
ncbi:hypothetical protein Tco_0337031 [Tanacetum coccineum]